jgi:predicted alpha/beta superfamily hydrolase
MVIFCSLQVQAQKNTKTFPLGVIDSVHSVIMSETRALNIYLPPGYSPDSARSYPVIYLLDGGADEDFIHMVGLVQFYTFPWIERIPNSIVVGITNINRRRDFTYPVNNLDFLSKIGYEKKHFPAYGGSDKFISFIEKELQPYINKNYKCNGKKTIIGQSLGGLLVSQMLIDKPALFDTYMIMSPSLWWDDGSLLKKAETLKAVTKLEDIKVYIGVGAEGDLMINGAKQLAESLTEFSNKKMKVIYEYLPEEDHATMTHQAAYNAFKLLYPAAKK